MLTKVILDGPIGQEFGREWDLSVSGPSEALRMIDANKPGLFRWIKTHLNIYERYQVFCTYENGQTEYLDNESYPLLRKIKEIRFIPMIAGAGGGGGLGGIVFGAILIGIGVVTGMPFLISMGASMLLGGVIQSLSNVPHKADTGAGNTARNDLTSYYFNGPVNTTMQGVPVALILGTVLTGSHAISANITIGDLV